MNFLRRLGALWRDHPIVLLSAALYRIPFHPIRLSYFRRLELTPRSDQGTAIRSTPVRPADVRDLDLLARCFDKRPTFERRFASGEICLVVVADGAIVGYEWFSTKKEHVEERYGYRFPIPGDALYSYDAFTSESHRNRGIWRQVMDAAGAVMERQGKRRIIAHVEYGNPGSYAAHLQVGFRPIERYLYGSILGLGFLARTWVAPPF
jgi:GNAT superfamily N-acetyltransferase